MASILEDLVEDILSKIKSYYSAGVRIISLSVGDSLYINENNEGIILDKFKQHRIAEFLKRVNEEFPDLHLIRCYPTAGKNESKCDRIYFMASENFAETIEFKVMQISRMSHIYLSHKYYQLPSECYLKTKHLPEMSQFKLILLTSGLVDIERVVFGVTKSEIMAAELLPEYGKPFVEEYWSFPYR